MATLRAAIDASGAVVGARTFAVAIDQMRRAVLGIALDTSKFSTATAALQSQISGVKNLAFGFFGAFTGFTLLRDAANSIAAFDQELRTLAAIGQVPVGSERFEQIRQSALDLAGDTRFSVNEVISGLTELTKAGFSTSEALQAIRPVLDLATLGNLGLARAVDIVVSSLSQFGLNADQAARISDVLSLTAQETITDVDQLGEALRVIGPIASNLGLSFEDIVAILGVVSQAGTKASLAGTQLRSVFASLATPTDKAADKLLKFGITSEKLNKIFEAGGDQLFEQLRQGSLTTAEAFEVFDNRGATVALSASRMSDEITRLIEANQGAEGSARRTADEINKGLTNSFGRAAAAADAFFKRMAQDTGVGTALGSITNGFTGLLDEVNKSPQILSLSASSFKFLATTIAAVTAIRLSAWLLETTRAALATRTAINSLTAATGVATQVNVLTAAVQRLRVAFITAPVLSWATAIGIAASAVVAFGPHLAKRVEDLERFKDTLLSFRDVTELFERGFQIQLEGSKLSDRTKQLEGIEQQTRAVEESLTRARVQLGLFSKGVTTEPPVLPVPDLRGLIPTSAIDEIAAKYKLQIKQVFSGVLDGSITEEDAKKSLDSALQFFKKEKIDLPLGLGFDTGAVSAIENQFDTINDRFLRAFTGDDRIVENLNRQLDKLEPVAIPVDNRSLGALEARLAELQAIKQRIESTPIAESTISAERPPSLEFLEEQRRLQEELIRQSVQFTGTFDAQRKQVIAQSVAYFALNEQKVIDEKLTEAESDKLNQFESEIQRVKLSIIDLAQRKDELQKTRAFEDEEFRLVRQTAESRNQLSSTIGQQIQILELESQAYSTLIQRRVEDKELTQSQADNLVRLREEFDQTSRSIIEQTEAKELLSRQRSFEDEETSLLTQISESRNQLTKTIEDQVAILQLENDAYDRSVQRKLEDSEITETQALRLKELGDQATETAIKLAQINEAKRKEEEVFTAFKSDHKLAIGVAGDAMSDFARGIGAAAAGFTTLQEAADQATRNIIAGLVSAGVEALLFQNLIKPLFVSSFKVSPESVDKAFGRAAKGATFTSTSSDIEQFAKGSIFAAFSQGNTFSRNIDSDTHSRTYAFALGNQFSNDSSSVSGSVNHYAFAKGANSHEVNQLVSNLTRHDTQAFATGNPFSNTVVTKATIAPLALFGEKTPEAIVALRSGQHGLGAIGFLDGREIGSVPLTRGSGGRLGINLNKLPTFPGKTETPFRFAQGGTFSKESISREISRRSTFERALSNVQNTLRVDSRSIERELRPLRFGETNIKLPSIKDGDDFSSRTTNTNTTNQKTDNRSSRIQTINNKFSIKLPGSSQDTKDRVRRTKRQIEGLFRSGRMD